MGNPIVKLDDFKGSVLLQKDDNTEANFDLVRDEHADRFIRQVLGAELGNLFLADINGSGVPVAARFLSIFNPFQYDEGSLVVESPGLKETLKQIIWFYWSRQNNVSITLAGNFMPRSENAALSGDNFFLIRLYNAGIDAGRIIQSYIQKNIDTYPEFNGQYLEHAVGI